MAKALATEGDLVIATDNHIELVQIGSQLIPQLVPNHSFNGIIDGGNLSSNVKIEGKRAALVGATATNTSDHIPLIGKSFLKPPGNQASIIKGTERIKINGKAVARDGDLAVTCNDPVDIAVGVVKVISTSTLKVG